MWAAIKGFLTSGWSYISSTAGEIFAIGGAIIGAIFFIRKTGENSVKLDEQNQIIKNVEVKNEVENTVGKLSDDGVIKQLHDLGELRD